MDILDLLQKLPGELHEPTTAWLATKREKTQVVYRRDLAKWLDHCAASDIDPVRPSRPQVDLFIAQRSQGTAAATWVRHVNTLSSWTTYLVACKITQENLFAKRTAGALDRSYCDTRFLSLAETTLLIQTAEAWNTPLRLRNVAIVRLMATLGIRVGEVVRLRVAHLTRDGGMRTISVQGKGGKRTQRPLPDSVADALDAYLAAFPHEGLLFCTRTGGRLDESAIFRLMQKLARMAQLSDVTPHVLRHTFAVGARRLGAHVTQIQGAMGHSNSATTDGYLHAANSLEEDPAWLLAEALG